MTSFNDIHFDSFKRKGENLYFNLSVRCSLLSSKQNFQRLIRSFLRFWWGERGWRRFSKGFVKFLLTNLEFNIYVFQRKMGIIEQYFSILFDYGRDRSWRVCGTSPLSIVFFLINVIWIFDLFEYPYCIGLEFSNQRHIDLAPSLQYHRIKWKWGDK